MNEAMIFLIGSGCLAGPFILGGIMLWPLKQYWLVAGYNVANSDEEKQKFDIEPLSKHLGASLIALVV